MILRYLNPKIGTFFMGNKKKSGTWKDGKIVI